MPLKIIHLKSRTLVSTLCLLSVLLSMSPTNLPRVSAQGEPPPPRPKSNHETQIKVPCAGGVGVNTWNGNLFYPIPFLSIPNRSLPLALSLSYNSSWRGFATRFGHGMQLNYQMFYSRDESGNINVAWGDGRMDRFTKDAGSYLSPADTSETLREHLPGKYVVRTKEGIEFFFDSPVHMRLTKVQEPNGNALSFSYDADMRMILITDTSGRQLQLAYLDDRLATLTDTNTTPSRSIQFQYDADGNLNAITDAEGNVTRLVYDAEHFLTRITPPRGAPVEITYTNESVTRISSDVITKLFSYDPANFTTTLTEVVSGNDRITRFVYDATGRVSRVERSKDGAGGSVSQSFVWDASNNLITFTDEKGRLTRYSYDNRRNLTSVTDAAGHITTYTYEDIFNRLTSVTDPKGNETSYEYDARGNPVRKINALNQVVTHAYDARGDRVSTTDAKGHARTFSYDTAGNMIAVTNPAGNTTTSTFDGVGNRLTNTTPNGFVTTNEYDRLNRLLSSRNPLGERTIYAYDALSNLTRLTDAEGNAIAYSYDPLNRLLNVTDAAGQQTTYSYDSAGNLISITDAKGHITTFTYDRLNRRVSEIDPLGRVTVFGYDDAGNLTSRNDAKGVITTYTYDALNRLIGIDYPGTEEDVEYAYDAASNRTMARNSQVTVNYSYDALNRVQSITYALPGISKTVSYTYDAAGNRATMTDPDGGVTTYEHDVVDRLAKLTDPSGGNTLFTYDKDDRLIQRALANGTFTTYEYDQTDRLLKLSNFRSDNTPFSSYSYLYDHVGNRTRLTELGGSITTFGYDNLYRLTSVLYPTGDSQSYVYDAVGNRLSLTASSILTSYTYDAADRLLSAGATTYAWDLNGNLASKTTGGASTTYNYDFENRLTSVTHPDSSMTSFTYYPNGACLSRTNQSGQMTRFFHEGDNVLLETSQSGSTLARYISSGVDGWLGMARGGNSFFYHQDGLGSTTELTDASQSVVASYRYDVYGALRTSTGSVNNPYKFTGREEKAETDLYYYRARMYDPLTGRFTSKDPVRDNSDPHLYKYVKDNPVNLTDPDGKWPNPYQPSSGPWFYNYGGPGNTGGQPQNKLDAAYQRHDSSYGSAGGIGAATTNTSLWRADYTLARESWSSIGSNQSAGANLLAAGTSVLFGTISGQKAVVSSAATSLSNLYSYNSGSSYSSYGTSSSAYISSSSYSGYSSSSSSSKIYYGSSYSGPYSGYTSSYISSYSSGGTSSGSYNSGGSAGWPVGGGGVFSGGGGGGGSESGPLNVAPSTFLESPDESLRATAPPPPQAQVDLRDIFPTTGPAGTIRTPARPPDVIGGTTNAVDVFAVDFVAPANSRAMATVFATKTLANTYEHDYVVCNRFHDYTLETAAALPLAGLLPGVAGAPRFWYASTTREEVVEEAYIFNVFVNEAQRKFTVDSRWLTDNFPRPASPAHDYIFNFQIWAPSSEEAYNLLRRTLLNLANFGTGWTVDFANTSDPPAPEVLIKTADVPGTSIRMTVQNWRPQPTDVRFFGTFRRPSDRTTNVDFEFQRTLQPGFNVVELPVGLIIDAVVHIRVGDFLDKVYVGSGFWFAFADSGGGSQASISDLTCPTASNLTDRDLILVGCTQLTGAVGINGFAGMARTLNPNGRPVDIRQFKALTFFAKGNGKSYRVSLETDSVRQRNSADFHQFVFTTAEGGRQFVIPLASFAQQGSDPTNLVPFTGEDVKAVVFTAVGDPLDSVDLFVDRVAFTNSTVISNTTVLPNTTNPAGPYTVTTRVSDDVAVQTVSLFFSVNGSSVFTRVPMNLTSGDTYSGQIPGQPLGSEISYYVEATDGDGNVATDPVDKPFTTHRFQVSANPYALVEDYADTNPANRFGGNTFLFGRDTGAAIEAHYDKESLKLIYNVTPANSFAGYSTLLKQADLLPFNAVSFLVKGGNGRERVKIGLRDNLGNEPKIVLGEYLTEGVTTSWRKVTIPFTAFTKVVNWSNMESFVIAVEHRIGSGTGEIFFDDVKFETTTYVVPVVVDNFNDMTGEDGVGGSLSTSNGGATINANYDEANRFGEGRAGYRINFSGVTSTMWAAAGFDLLGLNASAYRSLSFYFKGARGDERPNVYLASREGAVETRRFVDLERYIRPSTDWQRVDIPLSDFSVQGVDLSKLASLQFVFEFEEMSGTVFLDHITIQPTDNPADNVGFYVRQQYVDFLNREPDINGFNFWSQNINGCGNDTQCREVARINVSAAFYLSIEFQETGYLVYRMYKAAYGDATADVPGTVPIIRREEFLPDTQRIGNGVRVGIGNWEQQLNANKNAFALEFVRRQRFLDAYPETMPAAQFVDKLNVNAGGVLSQSERDQLTAELVGAADLSQGRAGVLRKVAENSELARREFNRAFVLMQFYGYLRRNPNDPPDRGFGGWKFWLDKLDSHNGNFISAEMVKAFISSLEYRGRFGRP